uniref:Threonine-phosphate decarboxylase CobD n=1 Tax=Prevotella sp. GTC17254 TaxID=3236794 RepID=A0AB33ITI4_9BACT
MKEKQHGDDLFRYENIRINFSSNIWGHADLANLKEHLSHCLDSISHYPEPYAHSLEIALANATGIHRDEILVTSGSVDAIYLISTLFSDAEPIIPIPTFSEYTLASRRYKQGTGSSRKIHWICNPNNPTGLVCPKEKLLEKMDHSEDIFVIDQAYEDYTMEQMFLDSEVTMRPNVLLLHSMTKKYCIPGLRLGYVVGHRKLIQLLRDISRPWSINALAQEAGLWMQGKNVLPDLQWLRNETEIFRNQINQIEGYRALPTQTNFFLIKIDRKRRLASSTLKEVLAQQYGILIRDASNFIGLDDSYIRVATQLPIENTELVTLLEQIY